MDVSVTPDIVVGVATLGAAVYGVVQALKFTRKLPDSYAPIASIALAAILYYGHQFLPVVTDPFIEAAAVGAGVSIGFAGFKKVATNAPNPPLQ